MALALLTQEGGQHSLWEVIMSIRLGDFTRVSWEAAGAIGEMVAAVAVIITIIFLAIQIRTSNNLARVASRDTSFDQFSGWRRLLASDADVARVWRQGCAGEELSADDAVRFEALAKENFNMFVNWEFRARVGGRNEVAEQAIVGFVAQLKHDDHSGLKEMWLSNNESRRNGFSEAVKRGLNGGA